jgi:hypothetical protein
MLFFTIENKYRLLAHLLTEHEGEVTEQIAALQAELDANLPATIEALLNRATELRTSGNAKITTAKAIAEDGKADVERADKLIGYVDSFMTRQGMDEFNVGIYGLKYKRLPASIAISEDLDLDSVPEPFVRVKKELNKSDLLKAWKSNGDSILPAGVTVNTTGRKLTGYEFKESK